MIVRKILLAFLVFASPGAVAASRAQVFLEGAFALSEPADLSAYASFEVRLVDLAAPDTPVAGTKITRGERTLPLPFRLVVELGAITAGARYGLEARASDSGKLFETFAVVPVDPAAGKAVTLILEPPRALVLRAARWEAGGVGEVEALMGNRLATVRLRFGSGGSFTATAGCASWSGRARTAFSRLTFSDIAGEALGRCGPDLARLEAAMRGALDATAAFAVVDGALELRDAAGETLAIFGQPH